MPGKSWCDWCDKSPVHVRIRCAAPDPCHTSKYRTFYCLHLFQLIIMAPPTRLTIRQTPPPIPERYTVATTTTRTRFFNAYDRDRNAKTLKRIAFDHGMGESKARAWLKKRDFYGLQAIHRTRRTSTRLGRPSRVSEDACRLLVDPARNPIRTEVWEAQIAHHHIPVGRRQLQRKLKEHTRGGQKYKQAFVSKLTRSQNTAKRIDYAREHVDQSLDECFKYVVFTDEAHIDPTSQRAGEILRERGTRYDASNILERRPKSGSKFHIAASISWYHKGKLVFYNDEEDHTERPSYPPPATPTPDNRD